MSKLQIEVRESGVEDDGAVMEIVSNVLDFPDWYWNLEDGRRDRLIGGTVPSGNDGLKEVVRGIVESELLGLREIDELPVEPNVEHLTNQLVNYILGWKKWYPLYKEEKDRQDFSFDSGLNDEIYLETGYGDQDKSQGWGNIYMDEDVPLVQTAEGAKRFGGAVGSKIPESPVLSLIVHEDSVPEVSGLIGLVSETPILSPISPGTPEEVTGLIGLVSESPEVTGLAQKDMGNTCHDEKGKFCKKPSGVKREGNIYRLGKIKLTDKVGIDPDKIETWLKITAELQEAYNINPPRDLTVVSGGDGFAWTTRNAPGLQGKIKSFFGTAPDPKHIYLNANKMLEKNLQETVRKNTRLGHYMPQAGKVSVDEYILTHEFGHSYSATNKRSGKALWKNDKIKKSLSLYGKQTEFEGYAESFAEWHTSKGTTKNQAARAYAKYEGWAGGLRASGHIGLMGEMEDSGFQEDVPTIIDFFDGSPSRHLGVIPSPEPREEETERAEKIIAEEYNVGWVE